MASVATASSAPYTATSDAASGTRRIASLDIVRGLVMVLMAIDHVRVYAGVPAGGPVPGVFFTRWITHFVAPAFCFFAGTSIYLHARKLGNMRAMSRFLLIRGAWLVLLELSVLRVAWTFNFDFSHYLLAGVIWMLGWCMILMAAAIHLSVKANAIIGGAIVLLHNVTDFWGGMWDTLGNSSLSGLWKLLYLGGVVDIGAPLFVLYVLIPWIGVMMLGYAFGAIVTKPDAERRRLTWRIGAIATAAFIVLRGIDVYGNPGKWRVPPQPPQPAAASGAPAASAAPAQGNAPAAQPAPPRPRPRAYIRFLNTAKYPASLLFLLMTLGPTLLLLAAVDQASGPVSSVLSTFGRVPFFYYVLHIPLIHAAACVVSLIREGSVNAWLFTNHPMNPGELPDGYMWSLGLLYLVWAICVAMLYFPCRWFARVRATSRNPWLSYL